MMANWTITFLFKVNNVPTDVTAVVLSDPGAPPTYGARKVSDGSVVAAVGTALIRLSNGYYTVTLTNLSEGTQYQAWIKYTYQGEDNWLERLYTPTVGAAISRYINYDRFIRRFGIKNVTVVSNKDDPKTLLADAIQDSFDYADSEVDSAFKGSPYAVPLDFTPNGGTVWPQVESWASIIAFAYLFEARGWEEQIKKPQRMEKLVQSAYGQMSLVRAGVRQIPALGQSGVSLGASVVQTRRIWPRLYYAQTI